MHVSDFANDQVHAMELLLDGWVHELEELLGRVKWMRDEVVVFFLPSTPLSRPLASAILCDLLLV
jgi:hypothetical protein